jgi:hypothetical protein
VPGQGAQVLDGFRTLGFLELDPVTDPEFRVALWIMVVPLAQFRGRSNLLAPFVEVGLPLLSPRGQIRSTNTRWPSPRADSS